MKTIWKYPLKIAERQQIYLPIEAEILTVQLQDEVPCLWAVVDSDITRGETLRTFDIYGTGTPLPYIDLLKNSRKYIGTVQQSTFVWHVFEIV